MRLYLAVGHGEQPSGVHDPGAVANGWTEQTAGDIIVATIAEDLRNAGHTVRHEANQKDPNFYGTVAAANAWDADYTLAVHHDWSGSAIDAHGFYYDEGSKAKPFGQAILTGLEEAGYDVSWTWFRARPGLYLIRNTNHPAFLLESGPIGADHLNEERELIDFGHTVAASIIEAFGGTPSAPDKDTSMATSRHPEGWKFAAENGLRGEGTEPDDVVEKDELFEFLRRYDVAVVDALSAEIARLERRVAEVSRGPVSVDVADIASRVETRIRASLKESL